MKKLTILLFLLSSFACQHRNAIDNIDVVPKTSEADKKYSDVYKILDGTWNGQFNIYEDTQRQALGEIELYQLSADALRKPGIKQSSSINVQQIYQSKSPYFQTVSITDTYPESGKVISSKGVNKIQDGKMWCVVKKPEETIIHEGSTQGTNTIIWQSDTADKKEYFFETVTDQYYEIIGWGYYGDDDRSLSPKLWFYGKYERAVETN